MTQHAALYDYCDAKVLLTIRNGKWDFVTCTAETLIELADIALSQRITHLWVMDSCLYPPQLAEGAYSIKINIRHGKIATVSVWKRGIGHVNIIFPHATGWADCFGDAGAHDILIAIHYVEQALGIHVSGSPGNTGWGLLKQLHPTWIEEIPLNLRECHFTPRAGRDIVWQAETLSLRAAGKRYIHKFDRSMAFTAAATQTDIGVGTPVHVETAMGAIHEKGHPQAVGVWRCTVSDTPDSIVQSDMPEIWFDERDTWLSGPIIRLLRAIGYEVEVHEGWVFPEQHDLLVKWGKLLWDARQSFSHDEEWINTAGRELAYRMAKTIANTTVGFTAYKGFDEEEKEKARPDIRLQVVTRNAELMYHCMNKVKQLYGATPAMVYMDACYYLSDEPDGRAALPELVKREGKLGGFKYEGRIELTPDVRKMFALKMSVAQRLEWLNKVGWE